jgi:ligand-binding sensor domain-containing protein/signal transduction histidine kinase
MLDRRIKHPARAQRLHPVKRLSRPIPTLRWPFCLQQFFVLLLFSFMVTAAYALPPSLLKLSEYQKQNWQVEDGLPENNVRMIVQQPDGMLLLATSSGLARFDGQHFHRFPIEVGGLFNNEAVNALLPIGANDLWFGTDGRGMLHHTASGTVEISERAGFHNERIRMFYKDTGGVLWIATQNGVERLQNDHLESIPNVGMISGDITTPFAEDGYGGMFFVTSSGLFHWQNGVTQRYSLRGSISDMPSAVYRDPQRRMWVGTMRHLIQLVPRKCASCTLHSGDAPEYDQATRAAISSQVTALVGDAAGSIWIGTRSDGIWRFASDGLSHWNSGNGLPDDCIHSLFIDDEQNLWIGMLTGGLSRWRKGPLAPFGKPEGFHATYSANVLADSHGDLWLGTWDKGLFRLHNGKLNPTSPPGMPIATPIRALAEDRKGQLWVGTWFDGVYGYDGHHFHHYLLGNESLGNAISSILADSRGGLWIGTYTGVFYFPLGEPDIRHRSLFIDSKLVTCMIEDRDGSVLVGTSTGLYRIRDGKVSIFSGMPHPHVLSLVLDSQGYVWAGTKAGGLLALKGDRVILMPAKSEISDLQVNTAIEDGDGHLWLGTYQGIVRLSIAELHAVVNGLQPQLSAVMLGKADGMRSSECGSPSKPSSARLPDGTLWFATSNGFVHTTDVAEMLGATSPTATITGWTLSNDPDAIDAAGSPKGSSIELKAEQSDILFLFNAKLLANPAHVEYRYRLDGYDTEWTNTHTHSASYHRLPQGKYRFEVQARASGEEWSSAVAAIEVERHPNLYQTWYFYLALGLLAIAIAVQFFRRRMQLMKGRIGIVLEERNRIARECHDTLMAGFAAISWQLEATAKLFRDSDAGSTPAAASCELARSMVSHCQAEARRIIWDLRETDEVTNILSQALSRALAANQLQEGIKTTLEVEGDELPLAPGCVHHLVCIGQEAVSNAIRHAKPSHILILLKYDADALSLYIHDDGRGFQSSEMNGPRRGHFGIPVMEERARKLGGTLRLQTSTEAGTEVTVKVSFSAMRQPLHQEHQIIRWIGI